MPTKRGEAAQTAYDSIRERIMSGEFAPGDKLRETELADALGVSRTPVREALRRLHSEGFARFSPNLGAQVAVFTDREVDEVFRLRSRIDGEVVRLAARLAAPTDLAELREILGRMTAAAAPPAAPEEFIRINREFHERLTTTIRSPRLAEVRSCLIDVPFIRQTVLRYTAEMFERSIHHHAELLDAIEQHDGEWADAVATAHVFCVHAWVRKGRPDNGSTPPSNA